MQGHKVRLRPVEAADHHLLERWQNEAEIAHWMDYRGPFSRRDIAEDQERARREGHPFIIELDARPIGKCGLNQFRREARICALYLYIGEKDLWGRGFGRDTVMALCRFAFDELGMARVELSMLADNARGRRVYESCGFVLEGRQRGRSHRGGTWYDTVVMSVDRRTFERIRADYGI